jgi:hypothetical protein
MPVAGSGPAVEAKNAIRSSIKSLFPDRDCAILVRPMHDEQVGQLRCEGRGGQCQGASPWWWLQLHAACAVFAAVFDTGSQVVQLLPHTVAIQSCFAAHHCARGCSLQRGTCNSMLAGARVLGPNPT